MRRVALLLLPLFAAAPASAADLMVVGRSETLAAPRAAAANDARVKVDGRRCALAGGTALAALARTGLRLGLEDFGACSKRAAAAGGLYVRSVAGEAERGADGWVYKVDGRAPSVGAGDPSGRFGARAEVLWFWCRMGASGCQRTLTVTPAQRAVAPGATLAVTVRALDDEGRAKPASGARVTVGSAGAVAGADGVARVTVPTQPATLDVVASKRGTVRSFPSAVTVR